MMNTYRDDQRFTNHGGWNGQSLPSKRVLKQLDGGACASCGTRRYYLVLRVDARGGSPTVAARCSRCHEGNWRLSEERLVRDIERTSYGPVSPGAGARTQ